MASGEKHAAYWSCEKDGVSKQHTHDFDEYFVVNVGIRCISCLVSLKVIGGNGKSSRNNRIKSHLGSDLNLISCISWLQ